MMEIKTYFEISYNKYHYSEALKYYVIFPSNFHILEPNKYSIIWQADITA